MKDALGLNYQDTVSELTENYDGYHFSINSKDIFNPYSLIKAFATKTLGRYWYESAIPTFRFEQMKKSTLNIADMDNVELRLSSFNVAPDRTDIDASIPYLYQSGYLTIKSYDKKFNLYSLGFPNREVKFGFLDEFMPSVTGMQGADRDAIIETDDYVYIFEYKINSSPDAALSQIEEKQYALPYCLRLP